MYANVISAEGAAQAGKAIIVAGRRPNDSLWDETSYLADTAYNALLYRGYTRSNIRYLTDEPGGDPDGNGAADDPTFRSTFGELESAITGWATNATKLFVYLVDHGEHDSATGEFGFRLNPTTTVSAVALDSWFDALQRNNTNMTLTVVIDCCYAGGLMEALTWDGEATRVTVASCGADEQSYFLHEEPGFVASAFDTGPGEDESLSYPFPGIPSSDRVIHVRVSAANYGDNIEYQLRVSNAGAGGSGLHVYALDMLNSTTNLFVAPAGAVVEVDGVQTPFPSDGNCVHFPELISGTHTVRVTAAGCWAREDPVSPGKVESLYDPEHANPRILDLGASKEVSFAPFMLWPMCRVTGVASDVQTGSRVAGALLRFTAKTGRLSGTTYSNYQNTAWGVAWTTDSGGNFPGDKGGQGVLVPAAWYDVTVDHPFYGLGTLSGFPDGPVDPGGVFDFGTAKLHAVDDDGDGLADWWENAHFVDGTETVPHADDDADGLDNWSEYLAGTDPTNEYSLLAVTEVGSGEDDATLTWTAQPDRSYLVITSAVLDRLQGSIAAGPFTTNRPSTMSWTDTNSLSAPRFYWLRIAPPE